MVWKYGAMTDSENEKSLSDHPWKRKRTRTLVLPVTASDVLVFDVATVTWKLINVR